MNLIKYELLTLSFFQLIILQVYVTDDNWSLSSIFKENTPTLVSPLSWQLEAKTPTVL